MAMTVERLNEAVYKHGILWSELATRVAENENIGKEAASQEVAALVEKRYVSLPVAVALIDMIMERMRADG